jgi:hypothetical protein
MNIISTIEKVFPNFLLSHTFQKPPTKNPLKPQTNYPTPLLKKIESKYTLTKNALKTPHPPQCL